MAVTVTHSNHYHYQLLSGNIDYGTDAIKIILMNTTFTFDKDAHATLAAVTASQIATGNGYTQDSKTLTTVAVTEDDVNDKAYVTCDDPSWTASGGDIGPFGAAILYDDTTADDTVIGCVDFGVDYTIYNGASWSAKNIQVDQQQAA